MSHQSQSRTQRRRGEESSIRYVSSETTDLYDAAQSRSIREMCAAFVRDEIEPLEAERTTSRMHGRMWELRHRTRGSRQPDWSFGLGAPFARELARVGGPGAKGLLFSLGHQSPTRLQQLCFGLAFDLPVKLPMWANDLPHAELTRAAASSWDEPVQLVLLEFRRREHQRFTVSVMINDDRGGIVRRYALIRPLEELAHAGDPDGCFDFGGQTFDALEFDEACRRVRTAIDRTDRVAEREYDLESAKDLRALTLARIEPYLTP